MRLAKSRAHQPLSDFFDGETIITGHACTGKPAEYQVPPCILQWFCGQCQCRPRIPGEQHLNANSYVAALNEFLFHEHSYKPVSNPANGTGGYTASDTAKRKTPVTAHWRSR